jgi:hypothetical protein|eukprot:COSAG01_NODE_2703_length_7225_cov_5.003368_2_plen_86_part_00
MAQTKASAHPPTAWPSSMSARAITQETWQSERPYLVGQCSSGLRFTHMYSDTLTPAVVAGPHHAEHSGLPDFPNLQLGLLHFIGL